MKNLKELFLPLQISVLFVELENTIEGLVHVSYMTDDYYRFDDRQMMMIGEHTGKQFRIGDEVTVRVAAVKPEESAIDFEIVGMKQSFHRTRRETPKVIHAKKPRMRSDKDKSDKPRTDQKKSTQERQTVQRKSIYEDVAKKTKKTT